MEKKTLDELTAIIVSSMVLSTVLIFLVGSPPFTATTVGRNIVVAVGISAGLIHGFVSRYSEDSDEEGDEEG